METLASKQRCPSDVVAYTMHRYTDLAAMHVYKIATRGVASFRQVMTKEGFFSLKWVWHTYAYINSCTLNSQKGGFFRTLQNP